LYETDLSHSGVSVENTLAQHLKIFGAVQGVGMRPHLYKLAMQNHLVGWVKNAGSHVEVLIQGAEQNLQTFLSNTQYLDLPLAEIQRVEQKSVPVAKNINRFLILNSENKSDLSCAIKDYAICEHCKRELFDKNNRRYLYPFISCTNCGPRYSIFEKYPLDRKNMSLRDFSLCEKCDQEYSSVDDRRFHAQNICCEQCGPQLFTGETVSSSETTKSILSQAVLTLRQGKIIALKSSSGYKLICDATNVEAINLLRKRKNRPHKPFAVMFSNKSSLKNLTNASQADIQFVEKKENALLIVDEKFMALPDCINPYLTKIAACLPGSAIEILLLAAFDKPVIFTSGNIAGQTIISEQDKVRLLLENVADSFIHHNLKITHAMDDSVWGKIKGRPRPFRLGKGYAPLEFNLPFTLMQPVVAFGAYMKNTVAIAWGNRVVVSPHIGDTGDYGTWMAALHQVSILKLQYDVDASHHLIDSHHAYTSHQWVKNNKLSHTSILHHHAHASAVASFMPANEPGLVFTWDGTGLGEKNELWGGETFIGKPGNWNRVASLKKFALPGADAVIKQPWRTAVSLLWHIESNVKLNSFCEEHADECFLIRKMWKNKVNSPLTSSIGRLFDAAAAILGLLEYCSYDGQAAMVLEANSTSNTSDFISIPLIKSENGLFVADWQILVRFLSENESPVSYRATVFHNSLAQLILDQCLLFRRLKNINHVGLSGGVFQNAVLVEIATGLLEKHNFSSYICEYMPSNDASISYGQVIEYGFRQ